MSVNSGSLCLRAVMVTVLVLSLYSCGEDNTSPGSETTAAMLTSEGWTEFTAGRFHAAIGKFREALTIDGDYGDAYNGLGWSLMRVDSLETSLAHFAEAQAKGIPDPADASVGRAIILRDLEPVDPQAALDAAYVALDLDRIYVFRHDNSLDWKDVRLVMAQCHFALREYEEANGQVITLGGIWQDPESERFTEGLLAEIERLGQLLATP